jgi:hypothetical protein
VAFLEQLLKTWPEGELILILDNPLIHHSLEGKLWVLVNERVRFLI